MVAVVSFAAGVSLACLVTWRLNKETMDRRRDAEERLREETQIVETLHYVGGTLTAELDLHAVLQRVTDAATDLTLAQFGAFIYNEINESGEAQQLETLSGVAVEGLSGLPMPHATVRFDDVTREPGFDQRGHLPVRSYLAVPVSARDGEVYGGLFFGHPEVGQFDAMDERLVVGIAAHATIAIENARLYESQRIALAAAEAAGRRVEILAKAGQVLAASIEVEHTLADLTRLVTPDIADSCAVYLLDNDYHIKPVAAHSGYPAAHGEFGADSLDVDHPVHPIAAVVRTGAAQYLEEIPLDLIDASIEDAADRAFVHQHRPTSAIIVPMRGRARRDVIGALALGTVEQSGRRLTKADFDLAEELARRAAVAVEHARLYRAQRDVAETLQHSLLPEELPVIPGLQAAARYLPGGPDVEVGGDWYDMVSFADGTLGIVMGDVVGRGVPAASLMGQLRNALRAYALEDKDPCTVLQRLNSLMNDLGPSQSMATLLYGVFDLDSSTFTLANAGHPPPLIVDDKREASFVEGGLGPPLGAVVSPMFSNVTVQLPPGSTLFAYTDGLVEDRSTPLSVGLSLMEALVASGPEDLEPLCDYVMASALAGRSGGDDAALLALRVLPVQAEVHLTLPRRPDVIRALRTTLRRQLRSVGASKQEEFEILVATGEACANAIQHAGPASTTFDFEASVGDEVRIVVRDHGRWREGRPADGGRGLSIMNQFMDNVEVRRAEGGTEVVLCRALKRVASGRS